MIGFHDHFVISYTRMLTVEIPSGQADGGAGVDNVREQKRLEARKILGNAACAHMFSACFDSSLLLFRT
jgi:hypothetical protein